MKKLLLIINPVSGLRLATLYLQKIIATLSSGGYDVFTMLTSKRYDGTLFAKQYGEFFDIIVACGGDGTFNEVVTGNLQGANRPLGYIPCGSTNDFGASLGLSTDIITATQSITEGAMHSVDAGSFGNRNFTYVASFGAFTQTSYKTPQNIKNLLGHLAYILAGGLEIANLHPEFISLEADNVVHSGNYIFGAISNSTSVGGVLTLSSEIVNLNDGLFEIILIKKPESPAQLSSIIFALTTQQLEACEFIDFFTAKKITILKNPENGWSIDGEYEKGGDGVTIENLNSAIKLKF